MAIKAVYKRDLEYAREYGELEQYRASLRENIACRDAIEKAISEHHIGNTLNSSAAVKQVTDEYGFDRTLYVLANTVRRGDIRYSNDNKEWALQTWHRSETRTEYLLNKAHPGLINLFLTSAREQYRLLEYAKEKINSFCESKYGESADFSDLSNVWIASWVDGDENETLLTVDLVNYRIDTKVDGDYITHRREFYDLADLLERGLSQQALADMVPVDEEVRARIEEAKAPFDFSASEFEKHIPENMRLKSTHPVHMNSVYWVTQEPFSLEDLRAFQNALKNYHGDIGRFYITPRDLSPSYDFNDDVENKRLAIVSRDGIYADDYLHAMVDEGLSDYLGEHDLDTVAVDTPISPAPENESQEVHERRTLTIKDIAGKEVKLIPELVMVDVHDFMNEEQHNIGLQLYVEDEYGLEPYATLTVNFGEFIGAKDCAYIDTNNCSFAYQLLAQGIARDTGLTKHSGFCTYPLWKFDADFLKEVNSSLYERYSSEYNRAMDLEDDKSSPEVAPITKEEATKLLDELDFAYRAYWNLDNDDDESIVTGWREKALEQREKVLDRLVPNGVEARSIDNYLTCLLRSEKLRRQTDEYREYQETMQIPEDDLIGDTIYESEVEAKKAENVYRQSREALLAGFPETIAMQIDNPRLFVDMDGTLARFHDEVQYLERMYEPGFFRDLQPFRGAVESVKEFIKQNPDKEVYILSSALPGDPPGCDKQKNVWLDRYLPEIDSAHRLFPEMGVDKSSIIPGGIRATDVLLDDYNKNLEEWRSAGGHSVKFVNNINDQARIGKRWDGDRLHHDADPKYNAKMLAKLTAVAEETAPPQTGVHL